MSARAIPFMQSSNGRCGFFLPGHSGWEGLCCGEHTTDGRMFCDEHHTVTHEKAKPVTRFRDVTCRTVTEWLASEREPDLTEMLK